MKKALPLALFQPCNYQPAVTKIMSHTFDQQTAHHKIVAVLPAEMIFTRANNRKI